MYFQIVKFTVWGFSVVGCTCEARIVWATEIGRGKKREKKSHRIYHITRLIKEWHVGMMGHSSLSLWTIHVMIYWGWHGPASMIHGHGYQHHHNSIPNAIFKSIPPKKKKREVELKLEPLLMFLIFESCKGAYKDYGSDSGTTSNNCPVY